MARSTKGALIHPLADVAAHDIGEGTRIWRYTVVLENAKIGSDCNICAHVFIENDVIVGDRVTIKCGVQLWDGLRVGDDVFIAPTLRLQMIPTQEEKNILNHFRKLSLKLERQLGPEPSFYRDSRLVLVP